MSHKTLAIVAVAMLIVFGITILVYPMLFNPDSKGKAATTPAPVTLPALSPIKK